MKPPPSHVDANAEIHDFDIPDGGIYHGREGFLTWNVHWGEAWEAWRIEDLELRAVGDDRVLALFRLVARGRGSGIEIDRLDAIVYQVRDAKIVRLEYFNDREQALKAVGVLQAERRRRCRRRTWTRCAASTTTGGGATSSPVSSAMTRT